MGYNNVRWTTDRKMKGTDVATEAINTLKVHGWGKYRKRTEPKKGDGERLNTSENCSQKGKCEEKGEAGKVLKNVGKR